MLLTDYVVRYAQRRDVSAGHIAQLRYAVTGLQKNAGRLLDLEDWSHDLVNGYLAALRTAGRSDYYRLKRRNNLLTTWAAAADEGLVAPPNRRLVMRIKCAARIVPAWTPAQVRQLLVAAEALSGQTCGVRSCLYWGSYCRMAWDSGLRGCDLRSLECGWIRPSMVTIQRKTGKAVRLQLHPSTVAAVTECIAAKPRRFVWDYHKCIELWRAEARSLVKAAGLPGSIGWLRRSSGTNVEGRSPGRGHEHIGDTRACFERHYLARELIEETRPMPEEL